ncbi:MAG: methyltransferase domain-containing protein [bacterium]
MQYDPIKRSLGNVFNRTPSLRILFYKLLDLLLLRAWHVKRELRKWSGDFRRKDTGCWILDAGSGFGQYTYFLSTLVSDAGILAVDVKEEQVADCNTFFEKLEKRDVLFEVADLTTFSKPDKFDLILSVDVMEHIEEDEKVFRNFYDSLTQQGMLLISTPSDLGGSDVHDHDTEDSFIGEHVRDGYNLFDIQKKLKQAGFYRTEARYTYGKSGQLGWRLSMKYPILMLNWSKLFFILLPFYYLIAFPVALVCNSLDVRMKQPAGTGLIVKAWK